MSSIRRVTITTVTVETVETTPTTPTRRKPAPDKPAVNIVRFPLKGDHVSFAGDNFVGERALPRGRYKVLASTEKFGSLRLLIVGLLNSPTAGLEKWVCASRCKVIDAMDDAA